MFIRMSGVFSKQLPFLFLMTAQHVLCVKLLSEGWAHSIEPLPAFTMEEEGGKARVSKFSLCHCTMVGKKMRRGESQNEFDKIKNEAFNGEIFLYRI